VVSGVRAADAGRGLREPPDGFFADPDLPPFFPDEPPREEFAPFWGPRRDEG
jgi:hypothetical protein